MRCVIYWQIYHHHQDPWAESPYVSNANLIVYFQSFRSSADIVKLYRSLLHHSLMLSIHSMLGLPRLPFPSIIPNITLFIFLLFSILHICPNSPNFLFIIVCIRSVFIFSLFWTYLFVTFIVQFKCNILLKQFISKAKIFSLSVFLIVHVSQAYRAALNTHVFKTFNFGLVADLLAIPYGV